MYDYLKEIREHTDLDLIMADAYFANGPFTKAIFCFGLNLISHLHDNVRMKYIYTSEQKGRKRKRKFDEKVDIHNLTSTSSSWSSPRATTVRTSY